MLQIDYNTLKHKSQWMNIYTLGFFQELLRTLEVALNGQGSLLSAYFFSCKEDYGTLYAFSRHSHTGAVVIFSLLLQFQCMCLQREYICLNFIRNQNTQFYPLFWCFHVSQRGNRVKLHHNKALGAALAERWWQMLVTLGLPGPEVRPRFK